MREEKEKERLREGGREGGRKRLTMLGLYVTFNL